MKKLTQLLITRPKLLLALAAVVVARQSSRQVVSLPIMDEESEEALALARAKLNETELATRHYMLSFVFLSGLAPVCWDAIDRKSY